VHRSPIFKLEYGQGIWDTQWCYLEEDMIGGGRDNENCENNIWKICLRKNMGSMARQTPSVLFLFNSYTYNVYSRLCLTPLFAYASGGMKLNTILWTLGLSLWHPLWHPHGSIINDVSTVFRSKKLGCCLISRHGSRPFVVIWPIWREAVGLNLARISGTNIFLCYARQNT